MNNTTKIIAACIIAICIVAALLFLFDTKEEPPLDELRAFCEEHYNGTVMHSTWAEYAGTMSCLLPDGVECGLDVLYVGNCLNYDGAK